MTTDQREPEPNVQVFNLGHHEQMVLSQVIALATTTDELYYDILLKELDTDTAERLAPIFNAHGTVTIIRTNEEQ